MLAIVLVSTTQSGSVLGTKLGTEIWAATPTRGGRNHPGSKKCRTSVQRANGISWVSRRFQSRIGARHYALVYSAVYRPSSSRSDGEKSPSGIIERRRLTADQPKSI